MLSSCASYPKPGEKSPRPPGCRFLPSWQTLQRAPGSTPFSWGRPWHEAEAHRSPGQTRKPFATPASKQTHGSQNGSGLTIGEVRRYRFFRGWGEVIRYVSACTNMVARSAGGRPVLFIFFGTEDSICIDNIEVAVPECKKKQQLWSCHLFW